MKHQLELSKIELEKQKEIESMNLKNNENEIKMEIERQKHEKLMQKTYENHKKDMELQQKHQNDLIKNFYEEKAKSSLEHQKRMIENEQSANHLYKLPVFHIPFCCIISFCMFLL